MTNALEPDTPETQLPASADYIALSCRRRVWKFFVDTPELFVARVSCSGCCHTWQI